MKAPNILGVEKKVFKKKIKIFCSLGYYVDITNRLINNIKFKHYEND
jgi:hypothetical protein